MFEKRLKLKLEKVPFEDASEAYSLSGRSIASDSRRSAALASSLPSSSSAPSNRARASSTPASAARPPSRGAPAAEVVVQSSNSMLRRSRGVTAWRLERQHANFVAR